MISLSDVGLEELQRTLASQLGRFGVVAAAGVAVETVASTFINEDFDLWMCLAHGVNLILANVVVVCAKVQQDWAGGIFVRDAADSAGIVPDTAGGLHLHGLSAGRAQPAHKAAIT